MTKEEINQLEIGDKFTLEFEVADYDGSEITTKLPDGGWYATFRKGGKELDFATKSPAATKFEVGDTVRIIPDPLIGTVYNGVDTVKVAAGSIGVLVTNMDKTGDFIVSWQGNQEYIRNLINVHCLQLVKKAVKDKYFVKEFALTWGVCRLEQPDSSAIAVFCKNIHPAAKTAAKAECDRLNAEWRKQQETT